MILSIFANVVIWGTIAVVVLRIFKYCDIPLPNNKVFAFLLADKQCNLSEKINFKELVWIFTACILFRIVVYIISAAAVSLFTSSESLDFSLWLSQWKQWDANGYNNMIAGGYREMVDGGRYVTLVFFPLYSFIARIFNIAIQNTQISALLTSTLCYAGACCVLYLLAAMDFGRSTAKKAVLYISIFPFGFFFGAMLTESTFLLTSAATLYFIRKHNWIMVGLIGALAALSRISGIMLIFPAVVEFIEHYKILGLIKDKNIKTAFSLIFKKGLWILLAFIGVLIYMYCNYSITGDWLYFMELHEVVWSQETCYFGECIKIIWDTMLSPDRTVMLKAAIFIPEVIVIILMLFTMLYGIRRTRSMYTTYFVVYFIVNLSATWIISLGRYSLCAIPMFLCIADFSERRKESYVIITAISAILFGVYMTGYLFSKQIM